MKDELAASAGIDSINDAVRRGYIMACNDMLNAEVE